VFSKLREKLLLARLKRAKTWNAVNKKPLKVSRL
jgi:hypothetical protein